MDERAAEDRLRLRDEHEHEHALAIVANGVIQLFNHESQPPYDDLPGTLGATCREAERELRSSRAQLRRLYEADIIGIMRTSTDGRVKEANDALLRLIGYSREELEAGEINWDRLTPPEWLATDAAVIESFRTHHVAATWEKEYVHKDGRRIPIVIRAALIEGSATDAICFVLDDTPRKRAETELARLNEELENRVQVRTASLRASEAKASEAARALARSEQELRALAARVEGVREQERTELSREIHDVFGQDLAGLKLDVAWTLRRLAKSDDPEVAAARERLGTLRARIDESIATVRRIATGLRPHMLDDLGLGAALEWQSREFQNRTGIASTMLVSDSDDRIDRARATAVFRIYQELLTNVARHAHAQRVRSRLAIEHDVLLLEVADDGRGMPQGEPLGTGSLGLVGIRERALAFGGELEIGGQAGTGTRALVRVPLPDGAP